MNYIAKFVDGLTVSDIDREIKEMYDDQYRHGRSINRPRLWDLLYTRKQLLEKEPTK